MPCWYYDKKRLRETPSIVEGLSLETERRYRKEGARFILECGTKMGLGINTIATGVVYFHRFYMMHSFKNFPRYVTACCCLFLAGKVEETPKKCRDIIRNARSLLSDDHYYSFGDDPKEEVMTLERILLQTIKFDLQVQHPHTYLLKYAKCFKGDQTKLQRMVQMAWNFVNDSMSTVVCLQWEPEIIAVALIHLASKLSKFTVVDWIGKQSHHVRWWDTFVGDVTMDILEDICHQVLDLYQANQKGSDPKSPPQKCASRDDSPTSIKAVPFPNSSGSPNGKTSKLSTSGSSTSSSNPDSGGGNQIKIVTNISPPVTTTASDLAPAVVPAVPIVTGTANPYHLYNAPSVLNPHHLHGNMYTSTNVGTTNTVSAGAVSTSTPHAAPVGFPGTAVVPPLPPPTFSGPPPTNSWAPLPTHFSNLPPPIPPPHTGSSAAAPVTQSTNNATGGYYNNPNSLSYSRQSRY